MNRPMFFVQRTPLSDESPVFDVRVKWEWGQDEPETIHCAEDEQQAEALCGALNEAVTRVLGQAVKRQRC